MQPASDEDAFLERLFSRSTVFDGVVNLGVRTEAFDRLVPGEIKRRTGLNAGNHTMRIPILESRSQWIREHDNALLRVDRFSDLAKAVATGRYGVVFYVQSAFELGGSIEPLAVWKEQGLRALQISFYDNELGGGTESDDMPLTHLGRRAVRELNRLRIVVDVSHSGRRTTLDAAHLSTAPVTANHANALRLCPHPRNKSDEELRAIAQTGGVVAATGINRFLLSDSSQPSTIDDFAAHVDYMVQLIGIDHVGVSSDSYMDGSHRYPVDYSDPLLCSPERWFHLARRLYQRGYSRKDLEKILGLNFLRVYQQVLDP